MIIASAENRFVPLNGHNPYISIGLRLRNGIGHLAIHYRSDDVLFIQSIEGVGQYVGHEEP